ncbi:MAG: hypothetical protein ACLP9K_09955 [Nitrososphaerales archaeon]
MPAGSLLIEEMRTESRRDLAMAASLLETEYIEGVAWHNEQAFEKAVMYGYASFKISVQKRDAKSVAERMKEPFHTEKHQLVLSMLHEIYSSFLRTLNTAARNPGDLGISDTNALEARRFADRLRDRFQAEPIRDRLDAIEAEAKVRIDRWSKDPAGIRELISYSTADRARQLTEAVPDFAAAREFAKSFMHSKTTDKTISSVIDLGLGRPFFAIFEDFYRFPHSALKLAPYILPHSLTARYPIHEGDFGNLLLYRQNSETLREFYLVMNDAVAKLHASVGPFIESATAFDSLGLIQ